MCGKLKFGIVGGGAIARIHANAITAAGGELCGVYDNNKEMAAIFAGGNRQLCV